MGWNEDLAACTTDRERVMLALGLSERMRGRWIQGQRESVEREIERYRSSHRGKAPHGDDYADAVAVGKLRWSKHAVAADLISDEQFFSRLAVMYSTIDRKDTR